MFIWFLVTPPIIVALVFNTHRLDYRLISIAALVPSLSWIIPQLGFLNTLIFHALVLGIVMGATTNRRLVRRKWIGVPIGGMLRLIVDASWLEIDRLWWPVSSTSITDLSGSTYPIIPLGIFLDLLGLALCIWGWQRFGFADAKGRQEFARTGNLPRV